MESGRRNTLVSNNDDEQTSGVSVVIPALNEEANVSHAVTSCVLGGASEVLVIDGGSVDGTASEARACGAQVVQSLKGRAAQCRTGLYHCSHECVVFLHADTALPPQFALHVQTALSQYRWGAFMLELQPKHGLHNLTLRLVEAGVWARCMLCHLPYGDQALFARRTELFDCGGVPQLPMMEDFELVCRLKQRSPPALLRQRARSSSRRWATLGVAKARFNAALRFLDHLLQSGQSL